MGLHGRDQSLHVDELTQASPADVGHTGLCTVVGIQFLVFGIVAVGIFYQLAAILSQNVYHFLTDRLLEALLPIVTMHHIVGLQVAEVLCIGECLLLHHSLHTRQILEEGLTLLVGDEGEALIGGDGLIGEDTDDESAEATRPVEDGDMTRVDILGGEAHIDGALIDLGQFPADHLQVFGRIDLRAEHIPDITGIDPALVAHLIEGVLGIALTIVGLTELLDIPEPDEPVFLQYLIEGLGGHRIVEELDAHLLDTSIADDGLEVLLRQGQGAAHSHTAAGTVDHRLHHQVLKHQVAMHQNDVVVL